MTVKKNGEYYEEVRVSVDRNKDNPLIQDRLRSTQSLQESSQLAESSLDQLPQAWISFHSTRV